MRLGAGPRLTCSPRSWTRRGSRRSSSSPCSARAATSCPPTSFLPRLREIADQHGILLIADEIQTGFGRTGRLFAVEHTAVMPDILVIAKGLASGLPLSGIIGRRKLFEAWPPGAHGGTYGGNVVACAAANATLDVIECEGLVENADARGAQLLAGLRRIAAVAPDGRRRPRPRLHARPRVRRSATATACRTLRRRRPCSGDARAPLIALSAGTWGQVVRFIPPLVTTADEVDQALAIVEQSLARVAA